MSQLDIYLLADTHGYAESLATLAEIAPNEVYFDCLYNDLITSHLFYSPFYAGLAVIVCTTGVVARWVQAARPHG